MAEQLDRSEQATPKHRSEARRRGQVARSPEISATITIVAGLCALAWIGPALGHGLVDFTHQTLARVRFGNIDINELGPIIFHSAMPVFEAVALWIGLIALATLVGGFGQVGFEFADEVLSPQWERLNPVAGFGRLFSWSSAVRTITSVLKLGIIIFACRGSIEEVTTSDALNRATTPLELVSFLLSASLSLGWHVALAMGAIAAADYGYQLWTHERSLRMTKDEVKEEGKQSEQNPQVKGKIRGMMRQRHKERMTKALKTATVVVTNPTHVAVALKYDRASMKAPKVVAKGLRLVAQKIKDQARENGVPIIENKPLARSLYRHCPIGAEVPSAFYQAVAMVLAQVYRLAGKRMQFVDN